MSHIRLSLMYGNDNLLSWGPWIQRELHCEENQINCLRKEMYSSKSSDLLLFMLIKNILSRILLVKPISWQRLKKRAIFLLSKMNVNPFKTNIRKLKFMRIKFGYSYISDLIVSALSSGGFRVSYIVKKSNMIQKQHLFSNI